MKTIGSIVAVLASLAATGAFAQQAQDDTIAYSHRDPQTLVTGSSFRNIVLFGAAGGFLVDRIEGPHIARKYDVRDPQDEIAYTVASELAARRGDALADAPVDLSSLSSRELLRNPPPVRYLVDVDSTKRELMWSLFRGQWTKYTVGYRADLSVLDIPNQRYVVKDRCAWFTPKPDRASRRTMLAEDAGQLKAQFDLAAQACTNQFVHATQDLWRGDRRPVAEEEPRRTPPPVYSRAYPRPDPTYEGPSSYAQAAPSRAPRTSTYERRDYQARSEVADYGYPPPDAAPRSRAPAMSVDARGYLTWPGKRP